MERMRDGVVVRRITGGELPTLRLKGKPLGELKGTSNMSGLAPSVVASGGDKEGRCM